MATQPCPGGYYGDPVHECICSSSAIIRYQQRIPGPLLDRIDLHIDVPRVEYKELTSDHLAEPSVAICARVERAREVQWRRFTGTELVSNADTGPKEAREHRALDEAVRV